MEGTHLTEGATSTDVTRPRGSCGGSFCTSLFRSLERVGSSQIQGQSRGDEGITVVAILAIVVAVTGIVQKTR